MAVQRGDDPTMNEQSVFVVLPAYNESKALQALVPAIAQELSDRSLEIILVDDHSTDDTPALVAQWKGVFPLAHRRHEVNQGYGAGIRSGVLYAQSRARPDDVVVTLDADYTHLPRYIPAMIHRINEGYDVVTASYTMRGGKAYGVPLKRRILSWGVNRLFRFLTPTRGTRLYTNGFRAYRARVLQTLASQYGDHLIEENGFPGGLELFLKARRLGNLRDSEVPFDLHYENRGADSKIHIGQTIRAYLRLLRRSI